MSDSAAVPLEALINPLITIALLEPDPEMEFEPTFVEAFVALIVTAVPAFKAVLM